VAEHLAKKVARGTYLNRLRLKNSLIWSFLSNVHYPFRTKFAAVKFVKRWMSKYFSE